MCCECIAALRTFSGEHRNSSSCGFFGESVWPESKKPSQSRISHSPPRMTRLPALTAKSDCILWSAKAPDTLFRLYPAGSDSISNYRVSAYRETHRLRQVLPRHGRPFFKQSFAVFEIGIPNFRLAVLLDSVPARDQIRQNRKASASLFLLGWMFRTGRHFGQRTFPCVFDKNGKHSRVTAAGCHRASFALKAS